MENTIEKKVKTKKRQQYIFQIVGVVEQVEEEQVEEEEEEIELHFSEQWRRKYFIVQQPLVLLPQLIFHFKAKTYLYGYYKCGKYY